MGELLRLRGRNAADAELRAGDIQARMWSDLGNTIAGTVQNIQKERQEAPIRAQEAESRALALQGQRQQVEQGERLSRQDTAFMALLEQQPNPDPREVMSIYGPQRGMAIAQGLSAFGELQTGAVKDARDTAGRLAVGAKALAPQLRQTMWPAIRAAAVKGGLGSEQDIPAEPSDDYLDAVIGWATGKEAEAPGAANLRGLQTMRAEADLMPAAPEKPGNPTEASLAAAAAAGDPVARRALQFLRDQRQTGGDGGNGDPGPLETIIGPDGKAIRVPRKDAVGKAPGAGTEKSSSGVQKRVLNFFNRAEQADKDLEALEPEIEKLSLAGQTWQAWAPNFAQTQLGQSYTAAQRAFTEARLRKDSGAAIPDHEFESDRKTYFVQPGDSKKTIQDKNRARAAILSSLAFESGQALGEFIGDADEARAIVEGYKSRAAGRGQSVVVTAPDGSKHEFATQAEADNFKQLAGIK